jgi:glycosyltransferase involved in cell wall biosynthesis
MRIAILGIRGIPANYGGFETFAEHLAPRLVARGHDVTVYGRRGAVTWPETHYKGVRLVVLPTIHTKHLDTPVHTILASTHAALRRYDVVLVCNAANALFSTVLRATGTPVVLNVDGIERLRKKWGILGRGWYRMSEFLATKVANALVSDAAQIQTYYRERWNAESIMIPYGADASAPEGSSALETYGLEPRCYVLAVARLEPENNIDLLLGAFSRVRTNMRLVIVGDTPFASDYKDRLRASATRDPRVIMTGFVYGEPCRQLQANSYCYVHAADVGGTSPALLESMALGGCVIVSDTPQNLEVMGAEGWSFEAGSEDSLTERLQYVVGRPDEADAVRARARTRVEAVYSWDAVTDAYEQLLARTARR